MARTARPLNTTQLPTLAADLRALADAYDRGDAILLQRLLGDIADNGYPSRASGAPSNGSGGTSELTPVEAKASRRDRAAETARTVLATQREIWAGVSYLLLELANHRHDRPTAMWPCGHLKQGDYRRCQECGTGATPRTCDNCRRERQPHQKLHKSVALDLGGRVIMECDRCYKHRLGPGEGLSWGDGAAALALKDGLVVDGTYVDPGEWAVVDV